MKLSFRDLKQNKFTIEAEPSDLISAVKERIATEKGWEASTQKLIYSGKILQDANTVESYKIEEKGFIVCMTSKPKAPTSAPASASATNTSSASTSATTPVVATASSQPISSRSDNANTTIPSTTGNIPRSNASSHIINPLSPSGLSMGTERAAQIAELESMGFEPSQIDAAMRAAFYNSERAVEYLLNGIPENFQSGPSIGTASSTPAATPSNEVEGASRNLFDAAAALGTGAGTRGSATPTTNTGGLGNLDFLRNNLQFQQLRQVVQQQPHMLEPILQQVGAGNPQLAALIGDHSQQFLQLLSEDAESDSAIPPGAQSINVTEDERAAIERLCVLGFPRDLAIQAYFACDKNEELAANFLFDQPDVDEQ